MSRNEITLQEMFSSVIGELREGGRWGTAHIYQSAVNAFSAFTKWQPMPMRKLSPTVLKRFENYLRKRNCSWNTVSTYIKTVRSVYHRAVDRKYIRYVPRLFEHVYTGTRADRKKALEASDISSLVRETERSLQGEMCIRDRNYTAAEKKAFDEQGTKVYVNSEYVRLHEEVKVTYLVNSKTDFSKTMTGKFADEIQNDGKEDFYVHYHDSVCVYESKANEYVDLDVYKRQTNTQIPIKSIEE